MIVLVLVERRGLGLCVVVVDVCIVGGVCKSFDVRSRLVVVSAV